MMRVLHYIPSLDRTGGGTSAYMQLLARELGRLADLHVVTHPSPNPLKLEGCTVHFIAPMASGGLRSGLTRAMRRDYLGLIRELRPQVVHVNGCWLPQCALIERWSQRAGIPVVLSPHGMLEPWIIHRHYWTRKLPALILYQRAAVRRADHLHATAESEQRNLISLGWNPRITVIPNGIDVDPVRMKTSWQRTGRLLFLSRIHVKKGINFLLEAMAALAGELKDYQLDIAGEGDRAYVDELRAMADRLGLSGRVHLVGGVYGEGKWDLFRRADVFVLPTHSENFGLVVAEALAAGTPVITTQGTPWQDLETHHCGWWTDVGTEPTILSLRDFLQRSPQELEDMGRRGRHLVEEKYSARGMAENLEQMYMEMQDVYPCIPTTTPP